MNEPDLEEDEGLFYLYDDEDPPGVRTSPSPFPQAACDDWDAQNGYQAF